MSTYLAAFVVGPFDYVEGVTGTHAPTNAVNIHHYDPLNVSDEAEGVEVRVCTPLGKKEGGRFALDVASTQPFCLFWLFSSQGNQVVCAENTPAPRSTHAFILPGVFRHCLPPAQAGLGRYP
jgi:hypothetical protein